jgi:hypothetical protein
VNKIHAVHLNAKGTLLWKSLAYRKKVTCGAQIVSDQNHIIIGLYNIDGRVLLIIPPKNLPKDWFI